MKVRGMSQIEIAQELQVSKQLISTDIQYLKEQAKQSIKEYTTEHLPEQYQVCLTALDMILRHAYEILQEAHDNRERLAALELFKDTHMTKLELLSNATTIDSALNFIRNKQQQQSDDHSGEQLTTGTQTVF
jgi:biotin operon repressor